MKIGFYAFDVRPANAFAMIAEIAKNIGHNVVVVPPQQEGVTLNYFEELASCDVVCGAVSSFRTIGETSFGVFDEINLIHALSRLEKKVSYVIIEDVPGSSLKPAVQQVSKKVVAVVTARESWISRIESAEGFFYPQVRYLGPPVHWKESYMQMMGHSIRGNLFKKGEIGCMDVLLREDDKVIFYGGGKTPRIDNQVLYAMVSAGKSIFGERFVLAFKRHPGERDVNDPEAFEERDEILQGVCEVDIGRFSIPQLIGASDITVFAGGNTDSITAAYARMPCVYYYTDEVVGSLRNHGVSRGRWFVAEEGGVLKSESLREFKQCLVALSSSLGREKLQKTQEENFPLPEDWDTGPKIVSFLERIAQKAKQ